MKAGTFVLQIAVVLLLSSGCAKKINPNAPVEEYISPKIEQKVSSIGIPINYPLAQLEKQVNAQTPKTLYDDDISSGSGMDNLSVTVTKIGDIKIKGNGDELYVSIPLGVALEGEFEVSAFGLSASKSLSTDFSLRFNLKTKISLNPQWQVVTDTEFEDYEWIESPNVNILGFELPVDFILDKIFESQQAKLGKILDDNIKKQVLLKNEMQKAWNSVQEPILISEEYKTYLQLKPAEVMMKPIDFKSNQINTVLGMKLYLQTSVGAAPAPTSKAPLSNLKITNSIDNTFSLSLQNNVSRSFAIDALKKQFLGTVYEFGKRKIKIIDLDIYGHQENMVVKVGLEGSLKGYIYLEGKPVYDDKQQSIVIKDLNFGVDTKNALVKTAAWLFHGKINHMIGESMKLPVKTSLTDLRADIEKQIGNYKLDKYATLNGKINTLRLGDVYITKESIIAIVEVAGSLNLKIEDF